MASEQHCYYVEKTDIDLVNAVGITIGHFSPSSKLWKVHQGGANGSQVSTANVLCYLPYRYFDGFRLLNRYLGVSYHVLVSVRHLHKSVYTDHQETVCSVTHLAWSFYAIQQKAIRQMQEGLAKSTEYWNSRVTALDNFLHNIYSSPEVLVEATSVPVGLDPLLYDWPQWAKTHNKRFIYGIQPDMNSEHAFLCKTAGIPLCPNVQVMTEQDVQRTQYLMCSQKPSLKEFENGGGDAEGHHMDNDSERGHESCTEKYGGSKWEGMLFEENKAAVDSNVEAKNDQDANITLEDGEARQSHTDPTSADEEGWAVMKGYINWQHAEGTP